MRYATLLRYVPVRNNCTFSRVVSIRINTLSTSRGGKVAVTYHLHAEPTQSTQLGHHRPEILLVVQHHVVLVDIDSLQPVLHTLPVQKTQMIGLSAVRHCTHF